MRRERMPGKRRKSQRGMALIELLIAGAILVICSLGVLSMIVISIATNSRNKQDSTKTMLAQSVLEKVDSVLVGSATTQLTDCYNNTININTAAGGANTVNGTVGADIDFTQTYASLPNGPGGACATSSTSGGYQACYVVASPCTSSGQYVATYDLRWRIDQVGTGTQTSTYLVTVGARQTAAAANTKMQGLFFSMPTNLRQFTGRPQ